jgi:hypothetical protein
MNEWIYLCLYCQRRIEFPDDCVNDNYGNTYCSTDCLGAEERSDD